MSEKISDIKKSLVHDWESMSVRCPVVLNAEVVVQDKVKSNFLTYIDGIKTAEDIRKFFTLEPSEALLLFTDLINQRAIRFLGDEERLEFLKKQGIELKRQLEFLLSEQARLSGEEVYLSSRIREKGDLTSSLHTKLPMAKDALSDINDKLNRMQKNSDNLWQDNSELQAITKDMVKREEQIATVLERMEAEFPRIIKRKERLAVKIEKTASIADTKEEENKVVHKKLVRYYDVMTDVHEFLEDTKSRVNLLVMDV